MLRLLRLALALGVTTAIGIPSLALAHGLNNYWDAFWPTSGPQNEIAYDMTVGVPGGLGSSKHDHIAEGGKAWNQETDEILFKRSGDEVANFSASACSSHQSAIHYDEIFGTAVGTTIICGTGSTITGFQLMLDSLVPWWWTDDTVPNNYFDAQAVSTHEFGHAAGGWTNGTPERHFDENNNAALAERTFPTATTTPCVLRTARERITGGVWSYMTVTRSPMPIPRARSFVCLQEAFITATP